jgi:N-acetylglutamate synthase-like GNAT family acetyltransferase
MGRCFVIEVKKDSVKVRHVMHYDIDSILSLHKRIGVKQSNIAYMISSGFGGPMDFSFIAEVDRKVVGVVIAHLMYVYIPITELCLINGIMVDPQYKRHHLGSKLVDELIKFCRTQNVTTIRALAEDTNKELNEFVQYHGFHPSKIVSWDKILEP